MDHDKQPLFVDLDGTLIRTDLFLESALRLIKHNPLSLFAMVIWLLRGRSFLKDQVAKRTNLQVETLPFETRLVDFLEDQKRHGRRVVMATAAHHQQAKAVAAHLGLFDDVLATDVDRNLKGRIKLTAIRDYVGEGGFAYAGDSSADRPIWEAATSAVLVNAPRAQVEAIKNAGKKTLVIETRMPVWQAFLREMRPHQYAKNLLVFVPLMVSHEYQNVAMLIAAVLAFLCFNLCASGVYFLNDLLDLESDRRHARKRSRPLASGDLPLRAGLIGAVVLPLLAFALAIPFLPVMFVVILAAYLLITSTYSFFLKRVSTVDVMTLALLYTSRIAAGSAATGIALSSWLMAFSVFLFVSLAYLKRYIEVAALDDETGHAHGRGYSVADRETMFSLGTANITAAVLVLALYINSEEVLSLYQSPEALWLLCLLMLYWGNRIWVGARRGLITDDPVVFAIRDKVSNAVGLGFVAVMLLARYLG